jgi:hypothetical protein
VGAFYIGEAAVAGRDEDGDMFHSINLEKRACRKKT